MMGEYGEICTGLYFTLMDNIRASLVTVLDVILVSWLCGRMCLFLGDTC